MTSVQRDYLNSLKGHLIVKQFLFGAAAVCQSFLVEDDAEQQTD